MKIVETLKRTILGPDAEERSFYEAHDALALENFPRELVEHLREQLTWERVQTEEIPFHNFSGMFAADYQTNKAALIKAADSTVDQAIRAIADRISQLKMEVIRHEPRPDGRMEHIVVGDHPALEVLYTPKAFMDEAAQPLHTYAMQMRLMTQYLLTTGETYLLKIRDAALTRITRRLSVMPPQYVTPHVQSGRVEAYRITTGDGIWEVEPVSEVVRVWYPDMHNMYQSQGPFEPNATEYDGRRFASQHMRAHFQRDAIPRVVLEATGENPENIPEDITDRFLELWKQKYHNRVGTNTGLPFRLPPGWVAKVLNTGRADEHFVRTMEYYDKHLLRAFRVPKSVLGDISDAPARAGVETNQVVFDRYAVLPVTNSIADALTYQWIGPEYGWEYAIRFPEFIAKDEELELKKDESDLKNKVRSPDEIRESRGLPKSEWGEWPVGRFGDMPYKGKEVEFGKIGNSPMQTNGDGDHPDSPEGGENPEPDVATDDRFFREQRPDPSKYKDKNSFMSVCVPQVMAEGKTNDQAVGQCNGMWENRGGGKKPKKPKKTQKTYSVDKPLDATSATKVLIKRAIWQHHRRIERDYVPVFGIEMRKVFRMQEEACVEAIPRAGLRAVSAKTRRDRLKRELEKALSPSKWRSVYRTMIDPVRRTAFEASGVETLDMLPTEKDWIWTQRARELVRSLDREFLTQNLDTTTSRVLEAALPALAEGLEQGDSLSELAARVEKATRKSFTLRRKDSQRIARTEIGRASEAATQEGYTQSGVVERKEWNTSLDSVVRSSHLIEGQIVDLDKEFTLRNGRTALYPMDPSLPAEDSVNCRCFSSPAFEE